MKHKKKIVRFIVPDSSDARQTCGFMISFIRAGYNVHRVYADKKVVGIIAYIPEGDYIGSVYRESIGVMRYLQCRSDRVLAGVEMWFIWGNRIISQTKQPIKVRRVVKELFGDYKVVEVIVGYVITRIADKDRINPYVLECIELYNERG